MGSEPGFFDVDYRLRRHESGRQPADADRRAEAGHQVHLRQAQPGADPRRALRHGAGRDHLDHL